MASTSSPHLWLRAETKPQEHRAALSPSVCQKLINQGFKITIEQSTERIFNDAEYEKVGCIVAGYESWPNAPLDAYIVGLKELTEASFPLKHAHIFFAHCYKKQAGWKDILKRFEDGNGTLLDLEFLVDERGRRVAAFGYHAGFTGAAVGIDVWCHQKNTDRNSQSPYPSIKPFPNETELIQHIQSNIKKAIEKTGRPPKVMVIGALGRCGTGAVDFCKKAGIPDSNIVKWDMVETAKGGPFSEIMDVDIFVNCIYLAKPIPAFIVPEMLDKERNLSVIVDVSCDTTNPHNPIPVYNVNTTFTKPTLRLITQNDKLPLDVVAIDHLPTMLPREASEAFCNDLLPSLISLSSRQSDRVWTDAEKLYREKLEEMHKS